MRILRLYTQLPPLKGGMEQHIRSLSEEQRKMGQQVTIWFNGGEKTSPEDRQILGWMAVHKIRPQFLGIVIFYTAIIIRCLFHNQKYDAVHIHGDWSSFLFGQAIKKLCQAEKLFLSIHGAVDHYKNLKKKGLISSIKKASAVFCTGFKAHEFIKEYCPSNFQPSGLKELFFKDTTLPKKERFTIISIANFVAVKNHQTLMEIADRLPQFDFVWIGEGPLKNKLQLSIQKNQIDNIQLKGFLPPESIAVELQQAHVFMLASFAEGTPTALLEAMACALPLVSSKAGGISQLLEEGKNAYLIDDPMNVSTYIRRVEHLYFQEEKRQEMGKLNRVKALSYRWAEVASNITTIMLNA